MVSFVMEEAIIVIEATDIYLQTSVAIIAFGYYLLTAIYINT